MIETTPTSLTASNNGNDDLEDVSDISSGLSNSLQVHANLTKVEIPKFHSKIIECQNFGDQFSTTVDRKTNIPNVVKFTYLKSALNKNALDTIPGLTVTNENYDIALKIWKERYAKKKKKKLFVYGKFYEIASCKIYALNEINLHKMRLTDKSSETVRKIISLCVMCKQVQRSLTTFNSTVAS